MNTVVPNSDIRNIPGRQASHIVLMLLQMTNVAEVTTKSEKSFGCHVMLEAMPPSECLVLHRCAHEDYASDTVGMIMNDHPNRFIRKRSQQMGYEPCHIWKNDPAFYSCLVLIF